MESDPPEGFRPLYSGAQSAECLRAIQTEIGRSLRASYDGLMSESLPGEISALLRRVADSQMQSTRGEPRENGSD